MRGQLINSTREWKMFFYNDDCVEIVNEHHRVDIVYDIRTQTPVQYLRSRRYPMPRTLKRWFDGVTASYNRTHNITIVSDNLPISNRTFGVEIECYCTGTAGFTSREAIAQKITSEGIHCVSYSYTHSHTETWKITTDSSLNCPRGGFTMEVVSRILKGHEGLEELKKVLRILRDCGCRVNRSCGLHVHHGCSTFSNRELVNVVDFYRANEEIMDSLVSQSRRSTDYGWCKTLKNFRQGTLSSDRYHKVNTCSFVKYGTVEIRQHQGSLNFDKISHWILLTQRIIEVGMTLGNHTCTDFNSFLTELNLLNNAEWYLERREELATA